MILLAIGDITERKQTEAKFKQSETCYPRLRLEESVGFGDSPHDDRRFHRLSRFYRRVRRVFPPARQMFRINRVRLGGP